MVDAVVTGSAGMLGQALMASVPAGVSARAVTRADGDLASPAGIAAALEAHRPAVVVHGAAYTDVDGCERFPARAWRDNALATRFVADACRRIGARLICISTDYVFDGTGDRPHVEDEPPCPINVYGESKLAAEQAAASVRDHLTIRIQWVFGPGRRNFVSAVFDRALRGEPLRVVANQWGCPTYTVHAAPLIWKAALAPWTGVVHLAGAGIATWIDVAREALATAEVNRDVEPLDLDDWPSPARKPRFSVMALDRWAGLSGEAPPDWRLGVRAYVRDHLLREAVG
jgi:dTDP-4-dehydrorhamnose reductase